MDPQVSLVRRWAVDWLCRADPEVCEEILAPTYGILIGGFMLEPRDRYIEATLGQIARFPGLGLTIHELIAAPGHVAVRFTEHGASARMDGREAAWRGVALFRTAGERLTACWAEEDYAARRRQLDAGVCDVIDPPAAAPWNVAEREPDRSSETAVRAWLERGALAGSVVLDDADGGDDLLADATVDVNELFSAGDRVAFHATQRGRYAGGLDGVPVGEGAAVLHLAGLVHVRDGAVAGGLVVRDRLGLARSLGAAVA